MDASKFINRYMKFYFVDDEINKVDASEFDNYGIPKNLNRTERELEKYIIAKINKGCYDVDSFAWKAGKSKWDSDKVVYVNGFENVIVNGNRRQIKIDKGSKTLSKDEFGNILKDKKIQVENFNNTYEKRRELYLSIKDKINLYNFGVVNIINMMFFLTKGAVPIYDYYAHVAIKALYMDVDPRCVYVGPCPGKKDNPKGKKEDVEDYYLGFNLLEEYMWLLEKVFPEEIDKKPPMYIARELDQALWVYGHAIQKYNENE